MKGRDEVDFWSLEKIRSAAFIRFDERTDPLGVMLVNFRTPQVFDSSANKILEALVFLAGLVSVNDRLSRENFRFWEQRRKDSLSVSISEIVSSLVHNTSNSFNVVSVRFADFASRLRTSEANKIDKYIVQDFLHHVAEPLDEILEDFNRLEEYRKFDEFHEEFCQIQNLIDNSLFMLRNRFEKQRITIKKTYTRVPEVLCDKHQIQHMLLNLFLNAIDAMGKRGVLSVGTDIYDRYVRIRICDSGIGIAPQYHSEIFKSFFTTKKHGTGLGLPISRYIAMRHGGWRVFCKCWVWKISGGDSLSLLL